MGSLAIMLRFCIMLELHYSNPAPGTKIPLKPTPVVGFCFLSTQISTQNIFYTIFSWNYLLENGIFYL